MTDGALPAHWGLAPKLFGIVPSYEFFVLLGTVAGLALFWRLARPWFRKDVAPWLFLAALGGGVVGAKLGFWAFHTRDLVAWHDPKAWLSGRTVVGGLIGGVLAVMWARRRLGVALPSGNAFAPAVALGVGIGRIGCLCRGCCYGRPTLGTWGLDLGDGVLRYPTQIVEALFLFALSGYLLWAHRRRPAPGVLFRRFMTAYFTFRFAIEFIRCEPAVWGGLTAAQLASIAVVLVYGVVEPLRQHRPACMME